MEYTDASIEATHIFDETIKAQGNFSVSEATLSYYLSFETDEFQCIVERSHANFSNVQHHSDHVSFNSRTKILY